MKIVISSGHGKHIRGASGNPVPPQLDEVNEARRVVDRVAEMLACPKFHDDVSDDQSENLSRIVDWHNKQSRDLDVSVHFNAYDHSAHGVEVLYVTQQSLAAKVSAAIAKAGGFTDRGAKKRTDLAFLNNTNEPAILIETCFCDNTNDSNKYKSKFEEICLAIAESIVGESLPDQPPSGKPPVERPDSPYDVPVEDRPVLSRGDEGPDVEDLQTMLNWEEPHPDLDPDGDFGSATENAVITYQATRGLAADGICGERTWTALYEHRKPLPPPPHALTQEDIDAICTIAIDSEIAMYPWEDRGQAPNGYLQGMALAFAQTYRKLLQNHPAAVEMAKARTNSDKDALNIYRDKFDDLGMSNEKAGADTLRHLYALMLGHGMRESSGRHCEGRDMSASNTSSETAEAGLFQTSYNAHSASEPAFDNLMAEYSNPANRATCYLPQFREGVSCTEDEWNNYGSGVGEAFQQLCKECPPFAVETCALTLRQLANHYGPIIRKETELKIEADDMFVQVQEYVDRRYDEEVA
jgi:N-acetylmuramoyl-L-alanine amidase-like protein/putative peptidoglycan binding protein